MALYAAPRTLSLLGETDRSSGVVARLVGDSLVAYDRELSITPRLAESVERIGDTTLRFKLRSGVRWHDGRPLVAADVVRSVEKIRDPRSRAFSFASEFEGLVRIEAPADDVVEAEFDALKADFLEAWTFPVIPAHLVAADEELLAGPFAERPIGCGPFRFVRAVEDVEVVLEANDDYWAGPPALEGITLRIVPADRTAYEALLQGQLDLAAAPPAIYELARPAVEEGRLKALYFYTPNVWYVAWNHDAHPAFADPRVRRAMVHALDRDDFIAKALEGMARSAATTWPPGLPWHDAEVAPWRHDPDEARRLLDRAGWTVGDDGVRVRDGRPLAFTMLVARSPQEISDRFAAWIQESLREIGAAMTIEKLEFGAFLERRNAGGYEALMALIRFTSPSPDQYALYHSSARPPHGFNFFGLEDAEIDRLAAAGRTTFDPQQRRAIYSALQRRVHEIEALSPLFHLPSPILMAPDLEGVEASPLGLWQPVPGPVGWHRRPAH